MQLIFFQLYKTTEQCPFWEADSHTAGNKSLTFYGNQRYIIVFTKATISTYPEPDESCPYPHILYFYNPS
jgi:hypothetical protein